MVAAVVTKNLFQIPVKAGGLGKLLEPGGYQTWVCLGDHVCGDSAKDSWFCWVYHEKEKVFTPWAPNGQLLEGKSDIFKV